MKKRICSLLLILSILVVTCSCSQSSVNFSYFDGVFSPFFALNEGDMSVNGMVQTPLLVTNAETGDFILDAYTQKKGIADITVDDTDSKKLVCTIKLGEDVVFSDGTPITADDIIFSMYVYADTDYEGWSGFNTALIDGLENYRFNNSLADSIVLTQEQLNKALDNPDEKLKQLLKEKVIRPVLDDEYRWVERVYNDSAYVGTEIGKYIGIYPEAKDLFAFLYSIDENYNSSLVADGQTVLGDIKKQYGHDFKTLQTVIGEINLHTAAERCAKEIITQNMLAELDGAPVDNIRGIVKIDQTTVQVTLNSQDDTNVRRAFGIYVAPLHHYGDKASYNYENSQFGFTRGDLSKIREKNALPLGAGKYTFVKCENLKTITFKENDNYFTENSGDSKVTFKATGNSSETKLHEYYTSYDNYTAFR